MSFTSRETSPPPFPPTKKKKNTKNVLFVRGHTTLYERRQLDEFLEVMQDGGVNWKCRPKASSNLQCSLENRGKVFKGNLGTKGERGSLKKGS